MNIKKGCLAVICLGSFCMPAYALDWLINPQLDVTERYTDNLRLLIGSHHPGNLITTLSPSLVLGYIEDNEDFQANLRWNQLLYHDDPNIDFSEKLASINYKHSWERLSASLNTSYGEQASLSAESVQLGVNGSGQVQIQVARYTEMIAPAFSYALSEKNNLQIGASYNNTRFGSHPFLGLGFSNYVSQQAYVELIHEYTERLSLNATASYSTYQSNNNFNSTFNFRCLLPKGTFLCSLPGEELYNQYSGTTTLQTGFTYNLAEQWSLVGSAGIRDSNISSATDILPTANSIAQATSSPTSYTTNGKIYSGSINRSFEKGNLNLSANQQLSPASTGTQQQTTQFSANGSYQINERWSTNLNANYLIANSTTANVSNSLIASNNYSRTLTTLSSSLKWQWTPEINLMFTYTYMDQIYTQTNQSARADNMQLQFTYQPLINRQVK